jgi:thioredoxin 1
MSRHVVTVTDQDFEATVVQSPLPTLVDFTAAWCAPCRVLAPQVDAVAEAYAGRIRVGQCDVDRNQVTATRYLVRAMPTLLMFKDGKVIGQIVGAVPRSKIEALVEKALG